MSLVVPIHAAAAGSFLVLLGCAAAAPSAGDGLAARIRGDGIPGPLAAPGDAARGRRLALDRNGGACVLCHAVPEPGQRFMGDLGPALAGVGSRYSAAQLRLRVADSTRLNPHAAMPPYYRLEGLEQVAAPYRGRTILTAQQVEDVVAYLQSLQ